MSLFECVIWLKIIIGYYRFRILAFLDTLILETSILINARRVICLREHSVRYLRVETAHVRHRLMRWSLTKHFLILSRYRILVHPRWLPLLFEICVVNFWVFTDNRLRFDSRHGLEIDFVFGIAKVLQIRSVIYRCLSSWLSLNILPHSHSLHQQRGHLGRGVRGVTVQGLNPSESALDFLGIHAGLRLNKLWDVYLMDAKAV